MTLQDYRIKLHELAVTCGLNVRYHQYLANRWGWRDRVIRIFVGLLAVFGLLYSCTF